MRLIVNADQRWGIGKNNELLVHIPTDMKFFRETTTGHVIVMGRKTLESFPNQRPLSQRINIVLTSNPNYQVSGAIVVHNKSELLKELEKYPSDEIYVIGGASVYKMMLPYCDTAYVTKMDYVYDADTYFPDLDHMPEWYIAEESEEQTFFDIEYTFRTYKKQ